MSKLVLPGNQSNDNHHNCRLYRHNLLIESWFSTTFNYLKFRIFDCIIDSGLE